MKLKDVTTIISGGTPSTKKEEYWNGCISWITPKDLAGYNKMYISKGERNITDSGLKNSSANLIPKGSVLFSSRAPIGYVAIASNELCTNQGFKNFICDESKIHNIYLYYWLKNNVKTIEGFASGSTFKEISASKIANIEIELPSLKMQNKISKILSSLDKKIELNNKINNNLEEQLKILFNKWFYSDVEMGNIADYEERTLEDLVRVIDNRGKTPKLAEYSNFPIIDVKALSGDGRIIDYNKCIKFVDESVYNTFFRSGHPQKNDILISTVGSLAEMKLFMKNKGTIAQNVVALRCKNNFPLYIYQYLKAIKNDLISYNIGSVQPSIKVTQFIKHKIYIPNQQKLAKYENIAKIYTEKINEISNENEILIQLREILLPKLMNGEIDLENIEV